MTERINGNRVSLNKNSGNYVNGGSYPPELRQRLLIYLIDIRISLAIKLQGSSWLAKLLCGIREILYIKVLSELTQKEREDE